MMWRRSRLEQGRGVAMEGWHGVCERRRLTRVAMVPLSCWIGKQGNGDDKMLRRIWRVACCVLATAVTTAVSPPAIEIDSAEVANVMMFYLFEFEKVFRKRDGNVRSGASAASYQKSEVSFQLARAEDRPADLSACQPTAEFNTNCLPPLNQPDELRLFFQHAHRVKAPFRTKNVALSIMINYLRQIFI